MKIKQQKQIKNFLIKEFGENNGNVVFNMQNKTLNSLIENTKDKTENQMKTLTITILPRIALYKVLKDFDLTKRYIEAYMKKYMLDYVAVKKHKSMVKMERVPGFYKIYSGIFLKIMEKTDLQESNQAHNSDSFDVTITKCLWHTACVENGCEELCRLFCDADDVTYGNLKKIGFSRTKALGYGGDCCDFHFYKKNK